MNVTIVNSFARQGGAARAASRLHAALASAGIASRMVVARRAPLVRLADEIRFRLALLPYGVRRRKEYEAFRLDRPLLGRSLEREVSGADVINLHWVADLLDFESLPRLAGRAPILWTLHDMLPVTGGCHYDHGCGRYLQGCGACPQLGSAAADDLSARIFRRRRAVFGRIAPGRLHFVAPSRWLAAQVERSPLGARFGCSVVPNSLDLEVFAPGDRAAAREALGLPQDRVVALFVSQSVSDPRKGLRFLIDALGDPGGAARAPMLVTAGEGEVVIPSGVEHRHFPATDDDRQLARLYQAADALVLCSAQDNLPNTMLEALACGTPVIGFDVGGVPDMVRPGETGFLVPQGSAAGLGAALRQLARDPHAARDMGRRGRDRMLAECAPDVQARRYLALFERLAGARV